MNKTNLTEQNIYDFYLECDRNLLKTKNINNLLYDIANINFIMLMLGTSIFLKNKISLVFAIVSFIEFLSSCITCKKACDTVREKISNIYSSKENDICRIYHIAQVANTKTTYDTVSMMFNYMYLITEILALFFILYNIEV